MGSGTPGYLTRVKIAGTPTSFTGESMTRQGGVGVKLYQITNTAKQVWERTGSFSFTDGGSISSTNIQSIDYLFGKVLFKSNHAATITGNGTYYPMTTLAGAHTYNMALKMEIADKTEFGLNGVTSVRGHVQTIKDVSITVSKWADLSLRQYDELRGKATFTTLVAEVEPGGAGLVARAFMRVASDNRSGDVAALEVEEISMEIDGDVNAGFSWSDNVLS